MAKKRIKYSLKTSEELIEKETDSIVIDNTIKYKEDDVSVLIKISDNKVYLTRENTIYKIELVFENNKDTIGIYYLKENNKSFKLDIHTNKLIIDNNNLDIEYVLNDDIRYFKLDIGVML